MHTYRSGCAFEKLSDIRGKKVTVMGLGLNGGGEACARFFVRHGAEVTVTDMKSREMLLPTIEKMRDIEGSLNFVLGEHRIQDFRDAYCVIKNPGVKIEGNPYLAAARNIETDISIFLHFTSSPVIAVTGSKGKSSTASAIHYGLVKAGFRAFLGGNITVSPLTFLEETDSESPVVLELSSWQLADLRGRGSLKPFIAVLTKIVPDHQNWYGGMESYVADKKVVYECQDENCYTIVDFDPDEEGTGPENAPSWGRVFASETRGKVLGYSRNVPKEKFFGVWEDFSSGRSEGKLFLSGMEKPVAVLGELSVPGSHMRTNVLNAALVMALMNVPHERISEILSEWHGIDHRLQYFHTYGKNVRFYNDSCSTVPEAASAASLAFDRPVVLVCGGTDKNLCFEPLVRTLADKSNKNRPKAVFLLGGSGTEKLKAALDDASVGYEGPFSDLDGLLRSLKLYVDESSSEGDVVVFSPGATSFGLFANEFDRGNRFMRGVKNVFIEEE